MEKSLSKPKVIAGIATTLFAASLVTLLIISDNNKTLEQDLSNEKLRSEKLLSEKLLQDKEIAWFNDEIDQFNLNMNYLKGKNMELDQLLADSKKILLQKQAQLNQLATSNAGKIIIQQQLDALKKMKSDYEKNIIELNAQVTHLNANNTELKEENSYLNQKLAGLEAQYNDLAANNQLLKFMVADDYLVEGLKGKKDKPTFYARRTNKIALSFDIPDDIHSKLEFSIITPTGKIIEKNDQDISTAVVSKDINSAASHHNRINGLNLNRRIKMEYNPSGKLSRGIYNIVIYNNGNYLSSCQVHLK